MAKSKAKKSKTKRGGKKGGGGKKKSATRKAKAKPAKKSAKAKKAKAKKPAAAKKPAKARAAKRSKSEAPALETPVAAPGEGGWHDDDEGGGGTDGSGGVEGGGGGGGMPPIESGGDTGGGVEGAAPDDDDDDFRGAVGPGEIGPKLAELVGRAMIVQILGDAEAYFFDFTKLTPARRAELVEHHLAAFDQRKRDEGRGDWSEIFVPIALLGESMPPDVRGRFDLSAPHEGVILLHPQSNALLYAASKDDNRLAILAPDLATIAPHDSFVDEVFDPNAQSFAYSVDRSESQGFTLGEIETLMQTGGAELTLV